MEKSAPKEPSLCAAADDFGEARRLCPSSPRFPAREGARRHSRRQQTRGGFSPRSCLSACLFFTTLVALWRVGGAADEDVPLPASEAGCDLLNAFNPSCLLSYRIESKDFFYERRHSWGALAPGVSAQTAARQPAAPGPDASSASFDSLESAKEEERLLTPAEVFHFSVRRLQSLPNFFGSRPATSRTASTPKPPPPLVPGLEFGVAAPGSEEKKPLLESNGLVCEDDERVEEFGVKCRLIARSLGGRLGCEKRLIDISPDGRLPANIPSFSRVADACPMTCGLCEECAPGCALWFLGNTLCDPICNNAACQYDGGDCWSADCVVGPWTEWSECSLACGGPGVQRRSRQVKSRAKQGGSPCPKLQVGRD